MTKTKNQNQIVKTSFDINAGDYTFTFLNSGDLFQASYHQLMVNQWLSNPIDGSMNNIFLRIFKDKEILYTPLLGIQSDSAVSFTKEAVTWTGDFEGVDYNVTFRLSEKGVWFWQVNLNGKGIEADVIYTQDVGIGDKGFIRNNEAYLSQYIDHKVFEDDSKGYVVCSRQNQGQSTGFPYLQQGALTGAKGYLTDGFQFFGLSYKETNEPAALKGTSLPNEIYQYEFAFTGLQSEKLSLSGSSHVVFYGLFKENHSEAVSGLEFSGEVLEAWNELMKKEEASTESVSVERAVLSSKFGKPLETVSMKEEEIKSLFPNRSHEEYEGNQLLSFFTDTHEHVVLKEKELITERPHGHIIMSGQSTDFRSETLSTTSYMYGLFNAQLVIGNTTFNKLLSQARNPLNVMKTSGQRMYVEFGGKYRLLGMPSMFEIGFNYCRWYYKTEEELFEVTNFTTVDAPDVTLTVRSGSGKAYRYMLTSQVTMSNNEYDSQFEICDNGKSLTFTAGSNAESTQVYPELAYKMSFSGAEVVSGNEQMLGDNISTQSASLVVTKTSETPELSVLVQAFLHDGDRPESFRNVEAESKKYRAFFSDLMNGFNMEKEGHEELNKMNTIVWWYTHNMLVHYMVPHGLEQYGGAAWGTRDVCQGPTEYFMAMQKYDVVKDILKKVYSHQYEDTGNWPQWFMFDKYYNIQSEESHGDIIVWPLKVLSDYLTVTKDCGILQEKVPYVKRGVFTFTEHEGTIFEHAKKEIDYIKSHFLHDTHLSAYGDGDWDDTLQPANAKLKKNMVSSWTVSLTYQVMNQLSKALEGVNDKEAGELKELVTGIEEDFNKYMLGMGNGIIPGFLYMEDKENPKLMVHPEDNVTGIHYRLLPMTRSMIGELVSKEQAEKQYNLIKEQFECPDGVRLMNRPAHYEGGVSKHFKRAEQAANFGREIGLQYVHAHIRYVEAMAKLGKKEDAWKSLFKINPVGIQDVVPNAERRQSNAYFSSSDGQFNNRYEAQEQFGRLRSGDVKVKGGWRIYSSGPGIYLNQLISNCLGIRRNAGNLVIDPVLPDEYDGVTVDFLVNGKPVTFKMNKAADEKTLKVNGTKVEASLVENRYREGGFEVNEKELSNLLNDENNIVEVTV
ncbi:GH36-type glycosyl hydrolase domain-containing protein [Alteribacter aurantiacus]|uniref:GH36-type glycosyl hydrolase domain-containing protein n=1 Tax=Alteribacter aurantiacus TaxID=254410 RepID=UPI0003F9D26D|nr:cellobiose phosphorylase [Alteribacter aurantiacus]